MLTRLESLPNELFNGIFIYFDITTLYNSFWGLNQRFNNLVRSSKDYSLIVDRWNLPLLKQYSPQIKRLKVNTPLPIDLSQCSNLASLELCQANQSQIEQIRSDVMPNLVSLTISTSSQISLPLELLQDIFSDSFRYLCYAKLTRLNSFQISPKFQSFSLRTLNIACTISNLIPLLLQTCPNLSCLTVRFLGETYYFNTPSAVVYNHPLEEFILDDSFHKLSFETLSTLFAFMPNLKFLSLQFSCRVPFIELIESILNRLTQLNRFECDILEAPNDRMVDVEIIQEMNECFQYLQCIERENGYRVFSTEIN